MKILKALKRSLYFRVAAYFGLWASIRLGRWKPRVVAVVGSSGKTTLLHLLEAQLGAKAVYSHRANSAFGVPFNILGLERKSFRAYEWLVFAVLAPLYAFRAAPTERIYIVEADAERPGEGKFLAELLEPDIVIWLSLEEAHGANYDRLAHDSGRDGGLDAVKREMAREFGHFLEHAQSLAILNKDNVFIVAESSRADAPIDWMSTKDVAKFEIKTDESGARVEVTAADKIPYMIPALIPPEAALSVLAAADAVKRLGIKARASFDGFVLPAGRSSVLHGVRNTTLIDSTYNATIGGMQTMLELMRLYPARGDKWLVLGDMVEQGASEEAEHRALAEMVSGLFVKRVVLVGPRLRSYAFEPLRKTFGEDGVVSFLMPAEALQYLEREIKGGETILFKGARFLEGVVEKLLADPGDAARLCRREDVWARKRKQWGI